MDNRKILTIAIPTYNGSKTIRNLLNILMPQINDEVEIIICDNCSTDDTLSILEEYSLEYPQIRIKRNKKNLGADGNFLKCMQLATGKYTLLLSDDDILIEGSLIKIIDFLKDNQDISLAYLETVGFKDKYISEEYCYTFSEHSRRIEHSIVTTDKKLFFSYVDRQWGFTSSFLWNTDRCQSILNPEKYSNTYWLQSYIHIDCSNKETDKLGIIKGPCIAAGAYGIIGNYDTAQIEAIYYKQMLDYAITCAGYDKKQLYSEWVWKVCFLASRAILKEKAIGKRVTNERTLFKQLYKYPYAWLKLFPVFLLNDKMCHFILKIIRKKQKRNFISYVNRPTE